MDVLRDNGCPGWPVGIPESLDSCAQGFTSAIHGEVGILEHLAERFEGLNRGGAISHFTGCIKTIVTGYDGSPGIVGSLGSRDDSREGIQGSLESGSVPAFLIGLVNQRLGIGDEFAGLGKPVALALVGSLRTGPGLFEALVVPC